MMVDGPRAAVRQFLDDRCPGARIEPIVGDASTRRFYRVFLAGGGTRVLMDYGQSYYGESDDQKLTGIFLDAGLPVATIVDASGGAGCLLLEDLGPRSLEDALAVAREDEARDLLERAVDLAGRIAVHGTPVLARSERASAPRLDGERFRFEMNFYLEHYVRGLRQMRDVPLGLPAALDRLAIAAGNSPVWVLCHRDFHSRNIMVRADGRLFMVDIQDARVGPDAYDLASLLRDAYVDIPEDWIEPLQDRFLAGVVAPPPAEEFRRRFFLVAAQRMIKALGTFAYQIHRLGRYRYAASVPRTLTRLRGLLQTSTETKELGSLMRGSGLLDDPPGSP